MPRKKWYTNWQIVVPIVVAIIAAIATIAAAILNRASEPPKTEVLPQGKEYYGRILDDTSKMPVYRAEVTLEIKSGLPTRILTDSKGMFYFPLKISADELRVSISVNHKDYLPYNETMVLKKNELKIQDIEIVPKTQKKINAATFNQKLLILGQIIDNKGNPLSLAKVGIVGRPESDISDDSGNFTISIRNDSQTALEVVKLIATKDGFQPLSSYAKVGELVQLQMKPLKE